MAKNMVNLVKYDAGTGVGLFRDGKQYGLLWWTGDKVFAETPGMTEQEGLLAYEVEIAWHQAAADMVIEIDEEAEAEDMPFLMEL